MHTKRKCEKEPLISRRQPSVPSTLLAVTVETRKNVELRQAFNQQIKHRRFQDVTLTVNFSEKSSCCVESYDGESRMMACGVLFILVPNNEPTCF
ncbi:hypothetical protein TNCT_605001 [Trichonephila clavata]|uniref:Uncharacterized protein n=1 Tax=Trichonephila clavata TaxID=2740835 RepID=A0A8X6HIP9_TRICU|nr:hypothetical protein TNCT_605001 [Trichonephila clavata]